MHWRCPAQRCQTALSVPHRQGATPMTTRTHAHGLQVANELHHFINEPGAARHWGRCRPPSGRALMPSVRRSGPQKRSPAGRARPPASRAGSPGTRPTPARLPTWPAYRAVFDADRLHGSATPERPGHHRKRRCRAGHHGWPAAGGAHPERPLRPERRQRPLGLAVRRAVRHRCHRRSQRRRRRQGLQPRSRR